MSWTDERVDTLKTLWMDGLSASQIATQLGGVTRNAVIGKIHRLGLSGRGKITSPQNRARLSKSTDALEKRDTVRVKTTGNVALKIERQSQTAVAIHRSKRDDIVIPMSKRAHILDLNEHTCRWPIGDPNEKNFHYCGRRADAQSPYCAHHSNIAYQNKPDRRQRKFG